MIFFNPKDAKCNSLFPLNYEENIYTNIVEEKFKIIIRLLITRVRADYTM